MLNNKLQIRLLTLTFIAFAAINVKSQPQTVIPDINMLNESIDIYYNKINTINENEIRLAKKYRWLNYLPTPSYYPFAGGFGISMNLLAPLQEYRINDQTNAKLNKIHFNSALEGKLLKASCHADIINIDRQLDFLNKSNPIDSLKRNTKQMKLRQPNI
jgi:hypothetical protein